MPGRPTIFSAADLRASRSCGGSAQAFMHQADERVAVEILVQSSLARRRDRSVFFGDHDDERVALLAEAEGGAVAGAVGEFGIVGRGEREKCARGKNAIPVNDRGAVMQ